MEEEKKTTLRNRPLGKRSREPSVPLAACPSYTLRTLGGLPSRRYLKNYWVLERPPFSHLCGWIAFDLFTDVSVIRFCLGALLLQLVVAGTKMTTEREETEEATCRERLSEQQVAHAALCQGRQQGTTIAISPLLPEWPVVNT